MDNTQKIALFGGSFDPVTSAHTDIIAALSERFDRVVVMPTAISPFKTKSRPSASGSQRYEMLIKATRGMDKVTVSDYELSKEGVSYTVDTVKYLTEKYDGKIFTVIGSEEVPFLDKWKECEELKKLTAFYVIERSGFAADKPVSEAAEKGYKLRIAPFTVGSSSSGAVKIARAFGSDKLPVPKSVAKYIVKHGLYTDYLYITERYSEFGLKSSRIAHIKRVALAAADLAKRYGVYAPDAIEAALLHDIAKETTADWFTRQGLTALVVASDMPKSIRHAEYGAVIAKQFFGVDNEEIIEAIRQHTTGEKGMSKLSMVVFLADYIEEGRECDGVERVRMAARKSLEKGMEIALKNTIDFISQSGGELYPVTVRAYEYYRGLANKEEE